MSKTHVIYPIIACLNEARKFIKTESDWHAVNDLQKKIFDDHYKLDVKDLEKISDIIDSIATKDNKELMKFFSDRGFNFEIEPYGPDGFGVGSVLSVLVEWVHKHSKQKIYNIGEDKREYPAVKAKKGFKVFSSNKCEHPIVMLETLSSEKVFLTVADKEYEHLDLLDRVKEIEYTRIITQDCIDHYEGVIFPMVDLDQDVDISWMVGARLSEWFIERAEQKTRFKMNHVGAKVESAVRIDLLKCASANPYLVIDKPFFVWMMRPGLNDPLFVGYIDEEDWKDPGDFHGKEGINE